MATAFRFTILTPAGSPFEGEVQSVRLRATDGYLGVMANHAPMVTLVKPGVAHVRRADDTEELYAVTGGVLETGSDHGLLLLAGNADGDGTEDAAEARLQELLAEIGDSA